MATLSTTDLARLVAAKTSPTTAGLARETMEALRCYAGDLAEATLGAYASHLKRVLKHDAKADFDGLTSMVFKTTEPLSEAMLDGCMNAVIRLHTALGVAVDAAKKKRFEAAVKNYLKEKLPKQPKRHERGSMTLEYFKQLLQHAKDEKNGRAGRDAALDYGATIRGLILQYAFAFRGGQIETLHGEQFEQVERDGGKLWKYNGPRHKVAAVAAGGLADFETHEVLPELNDLITMIMYPAAAPGEKPVRRKGQLVERYKQINIGRLINRAATRFEWIGQRGGELAWVTHGLRHGAIGHQAALRGPAAARALSAHKTDASQQRYSVGNDRKLEDVRRGRSARGDPTGAAASAAAARPTKKRSGRRKR